MSVELKDKLYTSTQVAEILGVSLRTLYRYMEDGKIQSMRTASGRHRFTRDQILDFLNANQHAPEFQQSQSPYQQPYAPQQQYQQRQPDYFTPQPPQQYQGQAVPAYPNQFVPQSQGAGEYPGYTQVPSQQTVVNPQPIENEFEKELAQSTGFGQDVQLPEEPPITAQALPQDPFLSSVPQQTQREYVSPFSDPYREPHMAAEPARQAPIPEQTPYASPFSYPQPSTPVSPVVAPSTYEEVQPAVRDSRIRYFRSEYTDLIDLAKRIKEVAQGKDLEYAFTLYAGMSLHLLIKPFTILHFYANPEDMNLWKEELRLSIVERKEDANIGILINTDIVFIPTKEIGGFRVVEDKVLLQELHEFQEDELFKQFRQHLTEL